MSNRSLPPNSTRLELARVFGAASMPTKSESHVERLLENGFWCPRVVKPTSLVCLNEYLASRRNRNAPEL